MARTEGYPTPDNPEGEITYVCRPIWLPDVEEMIALVYGQMFETTKAAFWRQEGTMTPEQAAFYMAIASGMNDLEAGCNDLTCEQIIDCIENNPETATALQQWLTQNGYGTGAGNPNIPVVYDDNPAIIDGATITGCENDNLFGAITGLIDLAASILTSAFVRLETATQYVERTAILISGIPGIGLLPVDEFANFFDQIVSSVGENFDAQYTPELRDEYRCDLFCLVKDTCELDFQTAADYFFGRVGATLSSENFGDFIEWFITGVWEGEQICDAAFGLLFSVFAYGSNFFDADLTWFLRAVNATLNDPSSDWETLCEECSEFAYPELVAGWCANASVWGSVARDGTELDKWIVSSDAVGGNNKVNFEDTLGRNFEVLAVESLSGIITGQYAEKFNTSCVSSGALFDWTAIGGSTIKAAFLSSSTYSGTWQARITVSEIIP